MNVKEVHGKVKDFECNFCARSFCQMRHLKIHIKTVDKALIVIHVTNVLG